MAMTEVRHHGNTRILARHVHVITSSVVLLLSLLLLLVPFDPQNVLVNAFLPTANRRPSLRWNTNRDVLVVSRPRFAQSSTSSIRNEEEEDRKGGIDRNSGQIFSELLQQQQQQQQISSQRNVFDNTAFMFSVERANTMDEIMDVASFRNGLTSPIMMIQKQQSLNDSFDRTKSAIDGIIIGLIVGSIAGGLTGFAEHSVQVGLQNFAVIGGTTAALLGINNFMGRRVYVMTEEEAINRLTVDFVEGLKAGQDVGFVVRTSSPEWKNGRYKGTNGAVGVVDCQLRNSDGSKTTRKYGQLPPHVHIKNLSVDELMRRKGVGKMLIDAVEEYAKSETDAKLITVEVEDSNIAAVNLYKNSGYATEDLGAFGTRQKYGTYTMGRSILSKKI